VAGEVTGRSAPGPLAVVVRGGRVESVHLGHLVVLRPDGSVLLRVGDPDAAIWPRSSVKPLQAVATLEAGLAVDDEGLALACASHSGTDAHLAVVRRVLAGAGLTEADLQNTADLPLDAGAAFAWRLGGRGPEPITQNCSGKHAAMLATCVAQGWDTATYRDPGHPLQRRVRATVERLTGVGVRDVTVDGCGAPLLSTTVRGLARALGLVAAAAAEPGRADAVARVGRAMAARPDLVGGPGRDVTRFMQAWPGLVAKDGAEGVYAAGLPDGTGVAFKVADGSARPRAAVLAAALEAALEAAAPGGALEPAAEAALRGIREIGRTPVLGHGVPVGEVHAPLGRADADVDVGGQW
jgi:L-asparaginase II